MSNGELTDEDLNNRLMDSINNPLWFQDFSGIYFISKILLGTAFITSYQLAWFGIFFWPKSRNFFIRNRRKKIEKTCSHNSYLCIFFGRIVCSCFKGGVPCSPLCKCSDDVCLNTWILECCTLTCQCVVDMWFNEKKCIWFSIFHFSFPMYACILL